MPLHLRILLAALCSLPTGPALAGVLYTDPGWDLVYEGADDAFGANDRDALDGNWRHDQSDKWDGSAPGDTGSPPTGNAPGGVVALTEGSTTYLRIQDTGNPALAQPDGAGGLTTPWTDAAPGLGSNRRFYFGHDIETEHPGATSVLANGITLSFRARIASTGVLDPVYPDYQDPEGEVPDLQQITPWPAGGKGYNVKDDGKGMFTVQQDGADAIGFALALDVDTPAGIGSGLVMNNRGNAFLPGTDRATPSVANLVPLTDAQLLDWHEFWITVQASGGSDLFGRDTFLVTVYRDGSFAPQTFEVMDSFGAEFPGQFVTFGLPSSTSFGAVDVDFYSYKLGVVAPVGVPEPSSCVMLLAGLGGLAARRRAPRAQKE